MVPLVEGEPTQISSTGSVKAKPKPLMGWMARHGHYPKGTMLPETLVLACPRKRMAEFHPGFIPARYYEKNLEQNQQLARCCRHPELHSIAAFKSHPDEPRPDLYVFYCEGVDENGVRHHEGVRRHRRFFLSQHDREGERRPEWK